MKGKLQPKFQVGSRTLDLTNLHKVLYPSTGFTKADLIKYYIQISPYMIPHLRQRPVTFKRYPDGVKGKFFYSKRAPQGTPPWVSTCSVPSESAKGPIDFCVLDNLPSLVWAANLAVIEYHSYLGTSTDFTSPTCIVFDLDPGPPADIVLCCEVALAIREILNKLDLQCFAKTSGSKGLQIYVPLNTPATYQQTKMFARAVAEVLARRAPDLITTNMSKNERWGRVFIDWSQNDRHKTTICVYSLRARDEPTVSTPVSWDEVQSTLSKREPNMLKFTFEDTLKRVARFGDLFEPVLQMKQRVPHLLKQSRKVSIMTTSVRKASSTKPAPTRNASVRKTAAKKAAASKRVTTSAKPEGVTSRVLAALREFVMPKKIAAPVPTTKTKKAVAPARATAPKPTAAPAKPATRKRTAAPRKATQRTKANVPTRTTAPKRIAVPKKMAVTGKATATNKRASGKSAPRTRTMRAASARRPASRTTRASSTGIRAR